MVGSDLYIRKFTLAAELKVNCWGTVAERDRPIQEANGRIWIEDDDRLVQGGDGDSGYILGLF